MNIKLVVLDMDGTLLTDDHQVSKKNKEAIGRLKEKGVGVILASGRPYQSIYPYAKDLGLDLPIIGSNGAFVKSPLDEKIYNHSYLPLDLAQEIVDYGLKHNHTVSLYMEEDVFTFDDEMARFHWELEGLRADKITDPKICKMDQIPTKIIYYDQPERITKAFKILEKDYGQKLYVTCSGEVFLDFMNIEVSKGNALKQLMKEMNLSKDEVMAIGNNFNDVAMFEVAGLAIAMDNSPQDVKDQADYVTLSNTEEGVAFALDKYIK